LRQAQAERQRIASRYSLRDVISNRAAAAAAYSGHPCIASSERALRGTPLTSHPIS